jgi:hypothetical protein
MSVDAKVADRLAELIQVGDSVLATRKPPPSNTIGFDASVNSQAAYQWFTSVQNILSRVFGTTSEHYKNFVALNSKGLTFSPVNRAQGVLRAAHDDFIRGFLFDVRRLIEAEVFDDFLDQASALFDAGYDQAAAVVAGSVLEDGLRRLCSAHSISLPDKPKLDGINSELAKNGVYSKLTQKRITAIADIRNSAAHGKNDQYTSADVGESIGWIRQFLESQFT